MSSEKAAAIEKVILKHKGAISPEDTLAEVTKAGVETTLGYVRLIRGTLTANGSIPKMRQGRPKVEDDPVAKPRRKHGQSNAVVPQSTYQVGELTVSELMAVKELSQKFGGLDRLEKAVAAYRNMAS